MSLMKGVGANILRGVAGAGVLAGFKDSALATSDGAAWMKLFHVTVKYSIAPWTQ